MRKKTRLSNRKIEEAVKKIDPLFLNTPQFAHDALSQALGASVMLKIETLNPIRSFKGRGADLLVGQSDPDTILICASAGNFGQAMAYACRKRGIKLIVYASVNANPFKVQRMRDLGAGVVLYGDDFDSAKIQAKRVSQESGVRFIEDSLDIETVEGAGTMGLELLSHGAHIDVLLIALGNGAMINGIGSIFRERSPRTRIIAVQAQGAPAMTESWQQKKVVIHQHIDTIADGIAVRIPVPDALDDMEGIVDDAILVADDSIIRSMQMLHLHVGIVAEPSGAVGIAALLENPDMFSNKVVATIICGGNLTEEQMHRWLYV